MSPIERTLLVNQFQLLLATAEEEHDRHEYERAIAIFENGWEYLYDDVLASPAMPREDGVLTLSILQMYRCLQLSVSHFNHEHDLADRVFFPGFDGNQEARFRAFANWYCRPGGNERFGLFQDLEVLEPGTTIGDLGESLDLNSHSPRLDSYRRMLAELGDVKPDNLLFGQLSDSGVRAVLDAAYLDD